MFDVNKIFELENEIKDLSLEREELEYAILAPYKKAFISKWNEVYNQNYIMDLRIVNENDWASQKYWRKLNEPAVIIEFVDYQYDDEGEIYDSNKVPISHLEKGEFDDEDLTPNSWRRKQAENKNKKKLEKEELKRLKEKYD
jgi:hypothetical protein